MVTWKPDSIIILTHKVTTGRQVNEKDREKQFEKEHGEENEEEHEETESEKQEIELKVPVTRIYPQLDELLACMASGTMPVHLWKTMIGRDLVEWEWEKEGDTERGGRSMQCGSGEEFKEEEQD